MFEAAFPIEALKRREMQAALDTYKASQEYQHAREDNPAMITRMIDFSNPESVASMQQPVLNPYGYNNPYANPNLVGQNPGIQYSGYAAPAYGTWYGNGYNWFSGIEDNARYLIDGKIHGAVINGAPPARRGKSYKDKMEALSNCHGGVVTGDRVPTSRIEHAEQDNQVGYKIVKAMVQPHTPGTPYTMEELNPDFSQLKLIPDTPLVWTARDEEELDRLCEDIAVYDKAMAHTAYNIPTLDGVTREDWGYLKKWLHQLVEDYRQKELLNQQLDYRAPYRHRKLPSTIEVDGVKMPDLVRPVPVPIRTITISGDLEYDYDRGRDNLTDEEWDIFVDRAYAEMMRGATELKARDIVTLNAQQTNQQKPKQPPKYNPYDPISVRLYNMKMAQNDYQTHMDFYRYAMRNRMTPEQFENWWYGTRTNANNMSGKKLSQEESYKIWADSMVRQNMDHLSKFVPYDPTYVNNRIESMMAKGLNEFRNGCLRKDMSLAEFMQALGYLDSRVHDYNVYEQMQQRQQAAWNNMSHNTFSNSLQNYMLNNSYVANNPYYTSPWGLTDPRSPSNGQYIDLNSPLVQQKKQQFLDHCHTFQGHVPMSPVFR